MKKFYGTRKFITALQVPATCPYPEPAQSSLCSPSHFLKIHLVPIVHVPFPLFGLHKRINSGPMQMYRLRNKASFDGEESLAPRQKQKMEYHPLSAVGVCFFNIFAASLHTGARFSNRNLRTRRDVVTRKHLSCFGQALWPTMSLDHCYQKLLPQVLGEEDVHLVTHNYVIPMS